MSTPTLPQDLQKALDASNRAGAGYTEDDIRRELQPAIEQADRGELVEWNLQEILAEMQRRKACSHA